MVIALDSRSSERGHYAVFLGKAHDSHSTSLHPGFIRFLGAILAFERYRKI